MNPIHRAGEAVPSTESLIKSWDDILRAKALVKGVWLALTSPSWDDKSDRDDTDVIAYEALKCLEATIVGISAANEDDVKKMLKSKSPVAQKTVVTPEDDDFIDAMEHPVLEMVRAADMALELCGMVKYGQGKMGSRPVLITEHQFEQIQFMCGTVDRHAKDIKAEWNAAFDGRRAQKGEVAS